MGRGWITCKITCATVKHDEARGLIAARHFALPTFLSPYNKVVRSDDVTELFRSVEVSRLSIANTVLLVVLWDFASVLACSCLCFLAHRADGAFRIVSEIRIKWYVTVKWCFRLLHPTVG